MTSSVRRRCGKSARRSSHGGLGHLQALPPESRAEGGAPRRPFACGAGEAVKAEGGALLLTAPVKQIRPEGLCTPCRPFAYGAGEADKADVCSPPQPSDHCTRPQAHIISNIDIDFAIKQLTLISIYKKKKNSIFIFNKKTKISLSTKKKTNTFHIF